MMLSSNSALSPSQSGNSLAASFTGMPSHFNLGIEFGVFCLDLGHPGRPLLPARNSRDLATPQKPLWPDRAIRVRSTSSPEQWTYMAARFPTSTPGANCLSSRALLQATHEFLRRRLTLLVGGSAAPMTVICDSLDGHGRDRLDISPYIPLIGGRFWSCLLQGRSSTFVRTSLTARLNSSESSFVSFSENLKLLPKES